MPAKKRARKGAHSVRPAEEEDALPTVLPVAVALDQSRGGYDCEFVEPPIDVFQTECPVCLQILKKPCVINCQCGKKICLECIERIKKQRKPCPLCNKSRLTFMRDHGLERALKEFEVWCSHKTESCKWRGKLGELEIHLNQEPSPNNHLNGCQFVAVECTQQCGEWFQRRHITIHESQQCKNRPYSCEHYQEYHSTFEDVTESHYSQCGKYPVVCPNECQQYQFERRDLEGHLQNECPLAVVNCPFHYAGCQTQLPRRDMPKHMRIAATKSHLT